MHLVVVVSFTPETGVLFPGGNVTFTCNITLGRIWIVGDILTRKTDNELPDGLMADGNMLIITESANNTLYGCGVSSGQNFFNDTGRVYLAGNLIMYCSDKRYTVMLECILNMPKRGSSN